MFPKSLDDAEVLCYTEKGDYGFISYDTGEIYAAICYYAIAKYSGDDFFYLFGCNSNYEVVSDYLCDSVEECRTILLEHGHNPKWYAF